MNQTKRNWLAALFATLAAVLLAAALCFALPFSDRRASGATVTVSDAAELQKQMAAAQEGDTIQLSADITIPSSALGNKSLGLYASEGHESQTLDLNGHMLSIETGNSDACFIVSGLTFTVVNSVPDQGGLAGKSHGSFVKGYEANLILRDIEIAFENNSGSASTAPVVAGFENRLTLDNVTYKLTKASKPYVANIAGSNYTGLAAAVDAASDGQTVQLVASFEEAVTIPAGKNITLDLNGNTLTNEAGYHTITNNGTLTIIDSAGGGVVDNISHARSAVCNNVGGTVEFSGGTFTRSREAGINTENNGGNSCYVLQNFGEMEVDSGVTVSMTSGYSSLFENGWYDGTQNATKAEAVLTINGGTFSGGLNTIKNDDWGVLTINGGKFTNMQQYAVLNWNKMEINGGTFEVTDDSGAVVYVGFANDSMDQGKLTITGGTFNGGLCAVYANTGTDIEISDGTFNSRVYALSGATIAITGGTFNHSVYSASCENFISGGTFTKEFPAAEYVAENCSLTQYGVVTDIAPAAEIEKDGKVYAFATIADALALASRGDTITLVGNVTENVVIAKNKVVTLDLNGYTLTNATGEQGDHTILNNGTLTIIDGSYAGTGRVITTGGQNCAAVYNAIGGEVTLDGGTYTSNRTTGDYYIIQNHGAMTINDGVTVLQPSVVSSGIASGWYTLAEESQTTYLTINGGTFASNRITVKNDEINVLVINGGTFDQTEGYGDAGYKVQSVQNWAIGILGGGTFVANVQSWAYQSGAGIVRGSLDITGGAYLGTVSAHYYINSNESREDDMPDVEISGGAFASQPAEKFLTAGFTIVSNSEGMFTVVGENSAEADALRTAQVNAQADVGQYLATLGLKDFDLASDDPYTGIQDDEVSLADETAAVNAALTALRTAYAYIAAARSEYDVAGARLAAMEAADALADALAAELSAYKAAATASIEEAAAATEQVGDTPAQEAVVVPTATYLAINSAETAEQVKQYWDNALQEISDIRTYRSGIEGQIDSLNALLTALNSEVLGADGTDGLRTVIIDAITTAQNAVMGASEGDAGSSLKDVYDFLDTRIEDVILEIRTELIGSDGQSGALGALQTDITTLLGLFAKDSEGYYTLQNVITEIGNAKDTILTGGENSVSAAIQAIGGVAGSVVDALTKEDGALTELSKGIAEVRALLVTTGAGSEEINRLESLAQAIEQAVDDIAGGDFTLSSLNTAIAVAQRELTGAIGTLETTVSGYNTLLGNYNTQLGTLSGTLADLNSGLTEDIAAAQEDIDAILADLAAVATDGDVTALSKAIGEISASLAQMQATVESIAAQVSAASAVEEAKEEGMADLETWLNAYLDELLGTAGETTGVIRAAAYTAETTDGDIYAKLARAFSEENAKLVLKYYNDALAAIDAAESVSDVTTAVSAFKAQVASVEAAAGNTPSLTAVYILLAVVLVVAIAVFAAVLLRRAPAPQPAAPAEGTPAAPAQETAVTEAAPEEEVSVSEGTSEDEASEEAPAEESAAEERAVNTIVLPELDGDREHIVIAANVRSFDEAYEALGDEARSLFNKVKAYALSKPDTEEIPLSSGVCIKRGSKKVVKLAVRRGNPVALFLLESDGLKDLRRSASASVRLKVRETELVLREESDLEAAYTMVDLSIGQIERDIEEAKERRREARRLRRRQLRETAVSEETEDIPEEGAADETPADESDE